MSLTAASKACCLHKNLHYFRIQLWEEHTLVALFRNVPLRTFAPLFGLFEGRMCCDGNLQSDIFDITYGEMACLFGGMNRDRVVECLAQERLADRRLIADMRIVERVEGADDLEFEVFVVIFIEHRDCRAKEDTLTTREFGVDDGHLGEVVVEEAHAAVDLAEAAFAINIFGIFAAIALCGGFGDFVDDFGAFDGLEVFKFFFERLEAVGSDVHDHDEMPFCI